MRQDIPPIFASPHLILLIGLPGSGKSTLAAQLQRSEYLLISTDAIRQQQYGDEAIQGSWLLIWREVQRQFRQAVQQIRQGDARAAIYDATNAVRRDRRQVLAVARSAGFQHITGLWVDTPLALCIDRNSRRDRQVPEAVIHRMDRRLAGAPPSIAEGWDSLIRYPSLPSGSDFLCENRRGSGAEIAIDAVVATALDCS